MEYEIRNEPEGVTLRLRGRFDVQTGANFFTQVTSALRTAPSGDLIVDLAGVDYIDSSCIGKLIYAFRHSADAGRKLRLANARGGVRGALEMLNVHQVMPMD